MRGKKFGGLAVLAAAWAASPTAQAQSQPYNDLNISTGPQTLLPQRDSERGIQIPGYFGGPAKMTTSAATSGVWYGAANLLNPQSAGTFVLYSGSWSESAKWSGAVVPDGGGTATLGEPLPPTSQERHDSVGIILNQNVALSQINMTNESGAEISNLDGVQNNVNTGKTITNTGTGLTINSNGFLRPFLGTTIWLEGNIIRPDIVGTGSVTVTGVAPLSLTGNNTFSGGLNIINGTIGLEEIGASAGDPGLIQRGGAALGTGSILMDGGSIQALAVNVPTPTPTTFNQQFVLGAGGGTLLTQSAAATFNGAMTGTGGLNWQFSGLRLLTANSTYTGVTNLQSGTNVLQGNGALSGSKDIRSYGTLALDADSAGSTVNRLADDANVRLIGGALEVDGSSAFANTETIGTLTAGGAASVLAMTPSLFTGNVNALNVGAMSRERHGGLFIRAGNLGATTGDVNKVTVGNFASIAVGGGGAAGTTTRSIIPWVVGLDATDPSAVTTQTGAGSGSFVSYDPVNGVQPLKLASEYAQSLAAAGATSNVRVTASEAISGGGKTINALLMGTPDASATGNNQTISGGTLSITSGAILNTSAGSIISAPVNFGTAEAVINTYSTQAGSSAAGTNGLSFTGGISGSGGLTKSGTGNFNPGNNNTYTGDTYIAGGRTVITGNVAADGVTPSAFGLSTTPVHFVTAANGPQGGDLTQMSTFPPAGGTLTFARDFITEGDTPGRTPVRFNNSITPANSSTLTFSGNGTLNSDLSLTSGAITFAGTLSGPGHMFVNTGGTNPTITFKSDNSGWTGGGEFRANGGAVINVAANNALGTGTLILGAPITIRNQLATTVTLPNPILMYAGAVSGNMVMDGNLRLTGTWDGGSTTRTLSVPSTGSVELAGPRVDGSLRVRGVLTSGTLQTGTLSTYSTGTVTLSGVATNDYRTFVGSNPVIDTFYPGVVRLNNDGALGNAGIEMDSDTAQTQLMGSRTMPARNAFIRGTGIDGQGSLRQLAGGTSTWGGNVLIINSGTLNSGSLGQGTGAVGVDAGGQLTVSGQISDITGGVADDGTTTFADGGTFVKVGGGQLGVQRISDTDLGSGTLNSASALTGLTVNAGTVAVVGGRVAAAGPTNKTSQVKNLTIAAGATLDLGSNDMVHDYAAAGPSPLQSYRTMIQSAYNNGSWNGTGLTSSAAKAQATAPNKTGLGYAEASLVLSTFPNTFSGATVPDNSAVLTRYTWLGDGNLDGTVNLTDFTFLAANFNGTGKTWLEGDYNYDGVVNLTDFTFLASNFNQAAFGDDAGTGASLGGLVPEPTSLGLVGLVAGGLLARRRRTAR